MLLPIGDPTSDELRSDYESARGVLALDRALCHPLNVPGTTKIFQKHFAAATSPMGVHPNAQPLADLFNAGDLAFVCNTGTLAYPSSTQFLPETNTAIISSRSPNSSSPTLINRFNGSRRSQINHLHLVGAGGLPTS